VTTTTTTVPGPEPEADLGRGAVRTAARTLAERRHGVALLAIGALAAALYAWNIRTSGYPPFYSMTVRSMSLSWKALVFGAVDPRATLTIDKLDGSFAPQALSARLFGYHEWSLALPQVLEGVVAVLVFHRTVRRWTGDRNAALLGALLLAFTPVVASMFEHSMEDGALTLCLVLAADRYQYAVMHGRLRSLVFAGIWVGAGFQAKMLEAWLILPALAVGYLVTAPLPRARRIAHTAVAGLAALLASLSWVLLYTLTPAADRPYVDGSTNNNAFAMVFGYNGLSRIGIHLPGALAAESASSLRSALEQMGAPPSALQNVQALGTEGWGKLFVSGLAPEIGWLYPLALLSLGAGLWWTRRAERTDVRRGGFICWGLWLVVGAVVYSAMTIPHTAYVSLLAPPICALSAAGIVLYWRTWLLPAAVLAEAVWTWYLAHKYSDFLPWLTPAVLVLSAAALALILFRLLRRKGEDWTVSPTVRVAAIIGAVAMLATPLAWAGATLNTEYSGNALDATAGPVQIGVTAGGSGVVAQRAQQISEYLVNEEGEMDADQRALLDYVDANAHTYYAFATDDWLAAQPFIDAAGAPVLPMGGFSGMAPDPTLAAVRADVRDGRLDYFLLDTPGGFSMGLAFGNVGGGPTLKSVDAWVRATCHMVPPAAYGVQSSAALQELYDCASVTAP
jgi:4-amino-4-deoxy-L-arabinose transferase-like glycosyltransferase